MDIESPAVLSQTEQENKAKVDSLLNALFDAPKARKQHYRFTHRVLQAMAHASPEKVLAMLKSAEGNAFLLDLWNLVGETGEDFSDEDRVAPERLSYSIRKMDEKSWIVIIRLLAPMRRNEAYFVALVLSWRTCLI